MSVRTSLTVSRVERRARGELTLRRLGSADLAEVKRMLAGLPLDYPGGDNWLERRLADVLEGRARCELATLDGQLAGLTIGTPKTQGLKLSTIFVAPHARRVGVGTTLLDSFLAQASARGRGVEIYVTAAEYRWPELKRLFESRGFTVIAVEADRYGPGRHEVVAVHVRSLSDAR